MTSVLRALALLGATLAAACASERASNRCKDVCKLEAQCVEQVGAGGAADEEPQRFDQAECVAACTALERDPRGQELVKSHAECALKAGLQDCQAVLACE